MPRKVLPQTGQEEIALTCLLRRKRNEPLDIPEDEVGQNLAEEGYPFPTSKLTNQSNGPIMFSRQYAARREELQTFDVGWRRITLHISINADVVKVFHMTLNMKLFVFYPKYVNHQ